MPVVDAYQRLDQALANLGDFPKRESALIELSVAQPFVDQFADQPFEPGRGRVGKGATGALDGVGDHQDGRLAGLRLGAGIAVRRFKHRRGVRVVAVAPVRFVIEVLDQRRAVVLLDQIDDRLGEGDAAGPGQLHL